MISGAPASIWQAPKRAAAMSQRPPLVQARSTARTTQGIQPSAAILLGHIRQLSVSPLKAKATPATLAASPLAVQRRARKYMPRPAQNWWSRQNTLSDQD